MKKSSKILLLVVTIITIVLAMPVASSANISGDFEYDILDDGTARIVGYTGSATDLVIPSTVGVDDIVVTVIGDYLFQNYTNLQSVTIPDSVTIIGRYAFYYCTNLQNVTIPVSVTSIWRNAFKNCTNLENMYYTGTADDWAKIIFDDYYSNPMYYAENEYFNGELVTNIVLSENIIELNNDVFYNCKSLKSLVIQNKTIYIASSAFEGCINLWHVLYAGTEEQWNKLHIGANNSFLIDATRHYEVSNNTITEIISPPTCTEQGYTTYTCECGESYVDNFVDETGHNHKSVITPPTCTEQGYTTYTCECGDSYIADFVDETGHSYGEWTVTKEATVDTEGEMERVCSCGEKEYKSIDKLPAVEDNNTNQEDNNKAEQEDTNKDDIKNPDIPDTNYNVVSSAYSVFAFITYLCATVIFMLIRRKCYK